MARLITTNLDNLLRQLSDRAVDNLLSETAAEVEAYARAVVPVDTGALRDSIETVRNGDADYTVGVGEPYARIIEEGDESRHAQPYLAPAVDKSRQSLTRKVERIFREAGR